MDTTKFYDLPKLISNVDFDNDKTDLRLHSQENIIWGSTHKREYQSIEKRINKFNRSGNGWKLYTRCDISGFQYWIKDQEENNYVRITISFDSEDVPDSEINNILNAIEDAICEFENLPTIPINY